MSIDTSAPLFTATAGHLVDTVAEARETAAAALRELALVRAEAAIERCQRIAYEARIGELEHQNRELRKANETWQERLAAMAPTVVLPRYVPESDPVRRRSGSRIRKRKRR